MAFAPFPTSLRPRPAVPVPRWPRPAQVVELVEVAEVVEVVEVVEEVEVVETLGSPFLVLEPVDKKAADFWALELQDPPDQQAEEPSGMATGCLELRLAADLGGRTLFQDVANTASLKLRPSAERLLDVQLEPGLGPGSSGSRMQAARIEPLGLTPTSESPLEEAVLVEALEEFAGRSSFRFPPIPGTATTSAPVTMPRPFSRCFDLLYGVLETAGSPSPKPKAMAADLAPSPCWHGEWSSAFHCCLGETWGVDAHVIQQCWTDGRSFETCCLQGQLLTRSEIRAWRTWNAEKILKHETNLTANVDIGGKELKMKKGDIKKINICLDDQLMGGGLGTLTDFNIAVPEPKVDCGCRRPEMSGDDIFCVLKDQLLPMSTQSQCMSYSYTYVVGTLVEWAGAWGRTGGRTLHVEDIVRCVPGMFMIMLADLTIRGMAPVEMDKWPSYLYLNQVIPLVLEATLTGVVQAQRYGGGASLPLAEEPCEATEETVRLLSAVYRAVAEQDVFQLRRAAAAVPAPWRLRNWSLEGGCRRGGAPACCEASAAGLYELNFEGNMIFPCEAPRDSNVP
ncbi:hypothetical protein AK812_SmicGene5888 [Symbiodinium microadriaticum]|uniref:Uncharacterized protein n=1 Tax=Symbiodinium microadriaticum TaxID=2951 RepID=A0A1Q9ESI7_SYMMI|nr:hypothetical protein AK812_SmicGene5888 [Symbiodinium microadriaticum]